MSGLVTITTTGYGPNCPRCGKSPSSHFPDNVYREIEDKFGDCQIDYCEDCHILYLFECDQLITNNFETYYAAYVTAYTINNTGYHNELKIKNTDIPCTLNSLTHIEFTCVCDNRCRTVFTFNKID